jgi:hypothetical protein
VQLKYDGAYTELHTDKYGAPRHVLSRTGRPYGARVHRLKDQIIGPPDSILIGEGTWHTEAGIRVAARDGHTSVHVFDALIIDGRDLEAEPYRVRRDLLWRTRATLQDQCPGRDWWRDCRGNVHTTDDGRFTAHHGPVNWGRAPIVEQFPARETEELWSRISELGVEGLVIVNRDAPVGRRGSKLKLKPRETLDGCIYQLDKPDRHGVVKRASITWNGPHGVAHLDDMFTVGLAGHKLVVGDIVEIVHEGFYESGVRLTPRFPRIVRLRLDLREPDTAPCTVFEAEAENRA